MSEKKISFWKIFWPSLVASALLSLFGWIFWIMIFGAVFSEEEEVVDNTVLRMSLSGEISERSDASFSAMSFSVSSKIGLSDILTGLEKAKEDKAIKGIYLELSSVQCGYATAYEIRTAIRDFKKSGKFVVAYLSGEVITQKQYFIASAASEVYGFPTSAMEFMGLGSELMFYKGTFDRLGLEMQVVRGSNNDFKSAVEPYFKEHMSDSSRLQMERYISSIWLDVRKEIAVDRKISAEALNDIAENTKIQRLEDAVKYKMIDGVKYQDEVDALVCKKAKMKDLNDVNTFEKYAKDNFKNTQKSLLTGTANVAVISAEGAITVDGDELTSKKICKLFKEVRNDDAIKIVVFRVNSPGGSALASEEIWREVSLTTKKKKVIVSMGDVAASGGYYISTPASKIFAEPTTITGSIGVFGVIPYTGKMLEDKLGLTFDRVQTNSHSVLSTNRKLTEEEFNLIQGEVDQIYMQFKTRVADGRGLTTKQVEAIARGRVWTGADAVNIGLVDEMGGLDDALNYAIKTAKISKPIIQYYPKVEDDPLADVLEKYMAENQTQLKVEQAKVPKMVSDLMEKLAKIDQLSGIQMRLPYDLNIH